MSTRKYQYGTWNQTNSNFEIGKTNETLTKEVIKDAIENNINVLFVGGCYNCTQCDDVFTQISNLNNTINKDFLFKQKIYLMTYHKGTNGTTRGTMKDYIDVAGTSMGITFSNKQYSGQSGNYSCHAVINMAEKKIYWVQGETSVSKSTITKILGDNPIPIQYKVTFKDSDGTTLKAEQYVDAGSDAIRPNDPVKTGYTFVDWDPSYKNITSNRTCIAQYVKNKNTYKVTFLDEDGITVLKGPIDVDEGETASEPTRPTKTGKTFEKWNPSNVNIQADTVCIACYVSSSGLYSNTITKRMFYDNRSLASIELPAEIAHIDESAFENCRNLTIDIPSKCKSIGARAFYNCKDMNYIKIPITMTSIGSEALASSQENSVIDMTDFNSSSMIPSIQANSFNSYGKIKFKDVNTSKHFYGNSIWKTYYSIFDPKISYTIRYNSNGGSGNIDSQDAIIGEKWTCKANSFSRDKYDFVNFNSKADGSGTTYNPGSSYNCPSSDITLYAIWKEKNKKVMAIITASNMNSSIYKSVEDVYDMIYSVYGSSSDIEYHCCHDTQSTIKNGTIKTEDSSKDHVMELFTNGVQSGKYSLVILYIFDHGSTDGYIKLKGKKSSAKSLYGYEIADIVNNGTPDTRIMFLCDCCHSGGVDPFVPKASQNNNTTDENNSDELDIDSDINYLTISNLNNGDEVDVSEQMFRRFDENKKNLNLNLFKSSTSSNPNPKILCWHNCEKNRYGWSTSGSKWISHIKSLCNTSASYSSNWTNMNSLPYWYTVSDSTEKFYGYQATKPSGAQTSAYGYKSNYNNNFDESIPIFT